MAFVRGTRVVFAPSLYIGGAVGSLVREVGQARASSRWWRWVTRTATPVLDCAPQLGSSDRSPLVTVRLYPLRYRYIATRVSSSDLLARAGVRARWRQA